mmetsp:Transcript_118476/g.342569  ORF Transcript_118476/g.342569 Transcript_118476/m.342569 type:complete len:319 (+) Transcript_118476:202-1158(+)
MGHVLQVLLHHADVPRKALDVLSFGVAAQLEEPLRGHLRCDLAPVVGIDEVEHVLHAVDVDAEFSQELLHRCTLHDHVEGLPSNVCPRILPNLLEFEGQHLAERPLFFCLHEELQGSVRHQGFPHDVHYDPGQNIEHAEDNDEDVQNPHEGPCPPCLAKRGREDAPVGAGDRTRQGRHGGAHASVLALQIPQELRCLGVQRAHGATRQDLLVDVGRHALHHREAEDVHDDEDEAGRPEQRRRDGGDGRGHLLEAVREADEADRLHRTRAAQYPEEPDVRKIHTSGGQLQEGPTQDENVHQVPLPVLPHEVGGSTSEHT